MLEAVHTDLVFTISLKRSTQNLQLSTNSPADYPILWDGPAVLLPRQRSKLAKGAKDKEHAMPQNPSSSMAVIGIDIGKNSFHIVGLDARGAIILRQKWSRGQVEARFANMPPCLIGMEACVGAHHLSRKLKAFGHDARLMPAKYVRPYAVTSSPVRRSSTPGIPAMGRSMVTRTAPASPALMVAELATAVTPQAQPPPGAGSSLIVPIWSGALPCGRVYGFCALSCRASSRHHSMCCPLAWCASSKVWPKTGAGSMSGSIICPGRLQPLRGRMSGANG